jgi:hypothetical protein
MIMTLFTAVAVRDSNTVTPSAGNIVHNMTQGWSCIRQKPPRDVCMLGYI